MRKILVALLSIVILLLIIVWYANGTNPYGVGSFVQTPFVTQVGGNGQIQLIKKFDLAFYPVPSWLSLIIDQIEEGGRIIPNRIYSEKPFVGNVLDIISKIHVERFDTSKPYVISAGHFGELYVRNFGIFYSAMMDPRTALSQKDWIDRQRVTLQTLATDLTLLDHSQNAYTTYFPVTSRGYMAVNIYAYPSDSLFSVVWTLSAVTNTHFFTSIFPANIASLPLQTQSAGQQLLSQHKKTLEHSIDVYLQKVIDPRTGLIKKNLPLSSARDQLIRQSSFYDNVIAWDTYKLSHDLGLTLDCPTIYQSASDFAQNISTRFCDLNKWKQTIITAFWDDKAGIFLDDLSQESIKNHIYSGDAFIVTSTQFLDLNNPREKQMLEKEIAYVQKNNLDKPFPLRYAIKNQPDRLYFFNKYFLPDYMGESIWSHWGMEYIKTLILLSDSNPSYKTIAESELSIYANNIVKYGGYPELYDKAGNIYQTHVYRSLLHTGWVVNFEQAEMMLSSIDNK